MILPRIASTAVGVPVVLLLIRIGGIGFTAAVALVLAIAALEFYSAIAGSVTTGSGTTGAPVSRPARPLPDFRPVNLSTFLGISFVVLITVAAHAGGAWWPGSLSVGVIVVWLWLVLDERTEGAHQRWLGLVGGMIYVGWLGSHIVLLREMDGDGDWLLMAIGAVFMSDAAAYFVGKGIGRHRLAPKISPGKTIEGTIGGFAAGWSGFILLNYATGLRLEADIVVPLGLLAAAMAPLGDLAESLFKRSVGIKDTGLIVPGHGGFLDRLDSVLFVTAVVYYYAQWATG